MSDKTCIVDQYGQSYCDIVNEKMQDKLIYDYDFKNYTMKAINESKSEERIALYGRGRWYLSGIFTITEQVNQNGNYYKNEVVEPVIEKYQTNIMMGTSLGETMHPVERDLVDPDLASVKCLSYYRESPTSNIYRGELLVLKTPKGRTLMDLLEDHVTLSVSTRSLGAGRTEFIDGRQVEVLTIWDLLGVDVVLDPSVMEAVMQAIREGRYINKGLLLKRQNESFKKRMDKIVNNNKHMVTMREEDFRKMINEIVNAVGDYR